MKNLFTRLAVAVLVASLLILIQPIRGQGTAFTYQGRLNDSGNPATGSYDLTFTLYNASNSGTLFAGPLTNLATGVTNGLFIATLDFGSGVFTGNSYWLEIGVRTNGGAGFATLTPRQPVTPTPYAIYSGNAGAVANNTISASQLNTTGSPASGQVLEFNGSSLQWTTPSGGSEGWDLTGNGGTIPGIDFLGTTDDEPLELWVNGGRAFRLEPGNGNPNVIGGSSSSADSSVGGGTIAGGILNTVSNSYPTVSGGEYNQASANGAVVGGGYNNTASGRESTVSGGAQNSAAGAGAFVGGGGYDGTTVAGNSASFPASTAVGGLGNTAVGNYATVVGGYSNIVNGFGCFVGGGQNNNASLAWSFVGGGLNNYAGNYYAAVVGGQGNQATGTGSFVGGGGYDGFSSGANAASGAAATIPGGWGNSAAGNYGFAAGHQAQAQNQGAFVWADSQNGAFTSTANDQFSVRANGGVRFITGPNGVTINGQPVMTGGGGGGGPIGWGLSGNTGTDPSMNYLGTADSAGLELRVNALRGLRLDYALAGGINYYDSINVTGGYSGNIIGNGFAHSFTVVGGTIAGGGYENQFATFPNYVIGDFGTVGGGYGNEAGTGATVPGGYSNNATGTGSFAAGIDATASDNDSFVWGDGTRGAVSQGVNSFSVLATGGIYLFTGANGLRLDTATSVYFGSQTRQMLNLYGTSYGLGVQASTLYQRANVGGGFAWYSGGTHSDTQNDPGTGGTTQMTLDASGNLNVTANASICSLTIRGGCDVAEPFVMSAPAIVKGSVVVIDDEHAGQLKLSDRPYDTRVAGIVSGANGINPGIALHQEGEFRDGQNVALSGRVYVLADASRNPITPGDLLTTSETPGHAMKVTDHLKAQGAILGKAMTALKEGKGMVLVLVTLQ